MLAPKEVSHLFELYLKAKPPHIGQKSWSEKKITDFCYSIKIINKFFDEDGMKKVGVYIVLDKKEQLNQPGFTKTLTDIIEMSDRVGQFLYKAF